MNDNVFIGATAANATLSISSGASSYTTDCFPLYYPCETVDLGLSVIWAICNLGARFPEEYGNSYAWGETSPYYQPGHAQDNPCNYWRTGLTGYNWGAYSLCKGSETTLTKYCYDRAYGYDGFTDYKTTLDLEDDAAYVLLGRGWRMPTDKEWKELMTNCSWVWTTENSVSGFRVTSSKVGFTNQSIFLPAAGGRGGVNLAKAGEGGFYWSSTLNTLAGGDSRGAWRTHFDADGVDISVCRRYYGRTIRPVMNKD